ncbi:MAG: phosphatase PAP2 family protein [Rhodanobacter sp.]|nr:phosphatase PAP2 family protein [Rhodanobacter sp.]
MRTEEKTSPDRLTRWACRVAWLFAAELLLIWALGSITAWHGDDAILQASSIIGGLAWLAAVLTLRAPSSSAWAAWRGTLLFAVSWLIFPLFKAIRAGWIQHTMDAPLLALDRVLWGGLSLPEHALALEQVWLSEVLSAGYFAFYFVVLVPVIWFAYRRAQRESLLFFLGLHLMYLLGFVGYLLVPAGGPYMTFPEVFPYPPQGGAITHFLTGVVAQGVTGMDVFPSLHSGISAYVWGFCLLGGRRYRAAAIVLAPVLLSIVVATVYLRYHYGIDLLAGMVLALGVLWVVQSVSVKGRG